MILIVNYNLGNIGSIANMLKHIGIESKISSDPRDIKHARKLLLPGVGSFDTGMQHLKSLNLVSILNRRVVQDKIPILGICLGMQLMTLKSDEGHLPGLGWIDAETVRFDEKKTAEKLRLPHMGWNQVHSFKNRDMFLSIEDESRFYFVHSYHVTCNQPEDVLTTSTYGYDFVSSFQKDNILGVQFHPEKSHRFGMDFLKKFAEG